MQAGRLDRAVTSWKVVDQMGEVTIQKANGIYELMDVECKMMRYMLVSLVSWWAPDPVIKGVK